MAAYSTGSRDYLTRAQALRACGKPEALLYAALEIRCGIEARLHEYLAGAAKIATVRKGLRQIRHLSRTVESVFDVYTKAVVATFTHPETGEKVKIEYTPVTPELRKIAEKLGDFLHFTPAHRAAADDVVERLTKLVDAGIRGLAFATRGTLLGPPAGAGRKNEQIRFSFEGGRMPPFIRTGAKLKFTMRVILVSKDHDKAVLKPS
jgi:hypothetical protein